MSDKRQALTKKRVCFVVASEMTVKAFLKEQIAAMCHEYDVSLIVDTQQPQALRSAGIEARILPVAIARNIAPWQDLRALWQLWRIFRRERFEIIHSVTPKAGLLAMLAGQLACIPIRIHTFTGQVWATRSGFSRLLLKSMDRLLAWSATGLLADSHSQRRFLLDQGITRPGKLSVLADGSISGVDSERFKPDPAARSAIRSAAGIGEDEVLLLFLGRLNREKGVTDLAAAFATVAEGCKRLHLMLVGPDEAGVRDEIGGIAAEYRQRLHFVDYTDQPETYFAASDIFCLPSYREGFGSVVIEAAACGLPSIGSRIYGISDAIVDGHTGMLFEAGNIQALADTIRRLTVDEGLRQSMGEAALARARADFSTERLVQAWMDYYDGLQ